MLITFFSILMMVCFQIMFEMVRGECWAMEWVRFSTGEERVDQLNMKRSQKMERRERGGILEVNERYGYSNARHTRRDHSD